jgi:hypothetical protein
LSETKREIQSASCGALIITRGLKSALQVVCESLRARFVHLDFFVHANERKRMKTRSQAQHRERLKNETETKLKQRRISNGRGPVNRLGVIQGQNGEQGNTTKPRQRKPLGKLEH